eukprot:CAMPEP_0167814550 /NCGR_PEP_ID=MMETSP0112_2-20121227/2486_1 /TAXON_ID=91324 /ORGANISM="Lotharella globosa, Strain CCCM811" /LENGTH=153 /DNA_ID=CAMNT_0007713785 /DNA_START=12 /DNA_END=473 /DNA_ORIENTATION=+
MSRMDRGGVPLMALDRSMQRSASMGLLLGLLLVAVAWFSSARSTPTVGASITGFARSPCTMRSTAVFAEPRKIRQVLEGRVISDKMDKSRTVRVERLVRHPKYHKRMRLSKNYIVHDPLEQTEEGDLVRIGARSPVSKRKTFEVVDVVRKAIK